MADLILTTDTATAAAGNQYATISEADTYFAGRLNVDAWDDANTTNRNKALIEATTRIDRLNFYGAMTETDQTLQFPRDDDTDYPDDIKYACAEIAFALLDGVDPEIEFENLNLVSQGIGNVRATYDRTSPPEHIAAGIPSIIAWRFLKPYLRDVRNFRTRRVS